MGGPKTTPINNRNMINRGNPAQDVKDLNMQLAAAKKFGAGGPAGKPGSASGAGPAPSPRPQAVYENTGAKPWALK